MSYKKNDKNIHAPLIIDSDILLIVLQSLSALMRFSQQVASIYYLVKLFYLIKLSLELLFVDIERCLRALDSLTFDAENYFDDRQALYSAIE